MLLPIKVSLEKLFFFTERENILRWQNWQNLWQFILAQSVYCPEQEDTPYLAQSAMASWQGSIRGAAAKTKQSYFNFL